MIDALGKTSSQQAAVGQNVLKHREETP